MFIYAFNVLFVLKIEKMNKKDLPPIFIRFRVNGIKIELSTNRYIELNNLSIINEFAKPKGHYHR